MAPDCITFTFNTFFYDFIKDLKKILDHSNPIRKQIKKEFSVKNNETTELIETFAGSLTESIFQGLVGTEDYDFMEVAGDLVVVLGHKVSDIVTPENSGSIVFYIYIFALLVHMYRIDGGVSDSLFDAVMNSLKAIQSGASYAEAASDILDDDILSLLTHISANFPKTSSKLEGTQIGKLAQEIANEMKIDGADIQRPEDILKGNGDLIGKIVSNVSTKLQKKFEDGSIQHDQLLKEAMSVIGGLGGEGAGGNIFANLMKNFANSDAKRRSSSAAHRLRSKLENKK